MTEQKVKFSHITAELSSQESNAFMIMGAVCKAMRAGGCSAADIKAYTDEAMSGDYDNLLLVSMRTVNVE